MTELRVTVVNTSEIGGTFLTPVYFGFHDGSFDLFNEGEAASAGLEAIAEDGNIPPLAAERQAADADSQGLVVVGEAGPVATQETTSGRIDVDALSNGSVSYAAMILPSNDAFIGSDEAIQLFSANGRFLGAQTITLEGDDVYDAGTEVNTEVDAAFLDQMAANTGVDENGVVTKHPGFNGSEGNPVGEGDQNIIGGTNAFGIAITEEADFTVDGAQIAQIHINTVVDRAGDDGRNFIRGFRDDDIVDAQGGNDIITTGAGWDVIDAGTGSDTVRAGRGNDILDLAGGFDIGIGGKGDDQIWGGFGEDRLLGGLGNDHLSGGGQDDRLNGGLGDDTFYFSDGYGTDRIVDFDRFGDDQIALSIAGVEDFDDVLDAANDTGFGVRLEFGADTLILSGVDVNTLGDSDFAFV
ncbi:MAG: spondin domain-containing protein [Pseudomonadota bacterium]